MKINGANFSAHLSGVCGVHGCASAPQVATYLSAIPSRHRSPALRLRIDWMEQKRNSVEKKRWR